MKNERNNVICSSKLKNVVVNKCLKLCEENTFLGSQLSRVNIIQQFIFSISQVILHISLQGIYFFTKSYRDLYWLFSHLMNIRTTTNVPKSIFYFLS